jgi:regulator of protease activity HflC (stomatin/prohibitin superfamily)
MTKPKEFQVRFWTNLLLIVLILLVLSFIMGVVAIIVFDASLWAVPLSWLLNTGAFVLAWQVAVSFMKSMYELEDHGQASSFLMHCLCKGRPLPHLPYAFITDGEIAPYSNEIVNQVGGPGLLVVPIDNAVVLERGGVLTRVIRGPDAVELDPFEKVWEALNLNPHRWEFSVSAITADGIPISYKANVQFQIADTKDDIFQAATNIWIRDAWRSEPERRFTWTKRVIIGNLEGKLRGILAHYELDQLLDPEIREKIRDDLEQSLSQGVAGLGVEIIKVSLGDIELRGRILQRWAATWRAERDRVIQATLAEGREKRTKALEKARAQVRRDILRQTHDTFKRIAQNSEKDEMTARYVILSFIEVLKRTATNVGMFLPLQNFTKPLEAAKQEFGGEDGDGGNGDGNGDGKDDD